MEWVNNSPDGGLAKFEPNLKTVENGHEKGAYFRVLE